MLRVCLDVNVWVSNYRAALGLTKGPTACQALVDAVSAGTCTSGPLQLVVSHAMMDTLEAVLSRDTATAPIATVARDQVELAAGNGYLALQPSGILGSAASVPLLDKEDAAVLMTAIAGGADLLVTANMKDFARGPRARISAETLQSSGKVPSVIRVTHPRQAVSMIIATPQVAVGWLYGRVLAPWAQKPVIPPDDETPGHGTSP